MQQSFIDLNTQIRCNEIRKGDNPQCAVFILHGYGADSENISFIADQINHDAVYIMPDGPEICDGNDILDIPAGEGRQWFSLRDMGTNAIIEGLKSSGLTMTAFIQSQIDRLQISHRRVAIIGFSQGGLLACHLGMVIKPSVSCIISCSGGFIHAAVDSCNTTTTKYALSHGYDDPVVPYLLSRTSLDSLTRCGIDARGLFLDDLGHSIDDRVIDFINQTISNSFADQK